MSDVQSLAGYVLSGSLTFAAVITLWPRKPARRIPVSDTTFLENFDRTQPPHEEVELSIVPRDIAARDELGESMVVSEQRSDVQSVSAEHDAHRDDVDHVATEQAAEEDLDDEPVYFGPPPLTQTQRRAAQEAYGKYDEQNTTSGLGTVEYIDPDEEFPNTTDPRTSEQRAVDDAIRIEGEIIQDFLDRIETDRSPEAVWAAIAALQEPLAALGQERAGEVIAALTPFIDQPRTAGV